MGEKKYTRPSDLEDLNRIIKKVSRRRPSLERLAGLTVVIIAGCWLLLFVDRVVMPVVVFSGLEVEVPDVHHLPFVEADSICQALGLELVKGRPRIDERFPPGHVMDQFPVAGVKVKPGRRIEVVVSTPRELTICPDVIGKSLREAIIVVDSSGLQIVEDSIRFIHSENQPEGVVVKQKPSPMTKMTQDEEIEVTLSLGKRPSEIVAPDLIGHLFSDVEFLLRKNDLRFGKITHFPDSSHPEHTVISQNPPPGTVMKRFARIDLRVAIKPKGK